MAYKKTNWTTETPINPSNLNKMEQGIEDAYLPIGAGCDYFGTVAPENYMFADGSAISRTEYAELFAIIGTTYGVGDGSTTFNLPDKREAVSMMKGSSYATLGESVGANSKKIGKDNLPNVAVKVKYQHYPVVTNASANTTYENDNRAIAFNVTDTSTESHLGTEALGSGTAFNVMQKTLVCNYIIRVK
jgi:microcystin-dependent protein